MRLLVFYSLLVIAAAIIGEGTRRTLDTLPARIRLWIKVYQDDDSAVLLDLDTTGMFPDPIPPMVEVDLRRVATLSDSTDEAVILKTRSGQSMRVERVRMHHGAARDIQFEVEALKSTSLEEVFETTLQTFSKEKNLYFIRIYQSPSEISDSFMEVVIAEGKRLEGEAMIHYSDGHAGTEDLLKRYLEATQPSKWDFSAGTLKLSDGLFQTLVVQNLSSIWFNGDIETNLTDETLNNLKAKYLRLGKAPRLTMDGVKRFLRDMDLCEDCVKYELERELSLQPSFALEDWKETVSETTWPDRRNASRFIKIQAWNDFDSHVKFHASLDDNHKGDLSEEENL